MPLEWGKNIEPSRFRKIIFEFMKMVQIIDSQSMLNTAIDAIMNTDSSELKFLQIHSLNQTDIRVKCETDNQ